MTGGLTVCGELSVYNCRKVSITFSVRYLIHAHKHIINLHKKENTAVCLVCFRRSLSVNFPYICNSLLCVWMYVCICVFGGGG